MASRVRSRRLAVGQVSVWLGALAISGALVYAGSTEAPAPLAAEDQVTPAAADSSRREMVDTYCARCHNDRMKAGGLTFSAFDLQHPELNPETAEKIILKVRTGMMPPGGMPRPSDAVLGGFAAGLEAEIDRAAAERPNPGRPFLHRLNRTEYYTSVRHLLDLDIGATSLLPADDSSQGFDNNAAVLSTSPTLMEAYVRAAGRISRLAVGDPQMKPIVETYRLAQSYSQLRHVEGTPFGTRGGTAVVHNFPADGDYVFKMTLYFTTNTFLFGSTGSGEQLEVSVNGERVALLDVDPLMKVDEDLRTPPIRVKAGPQTIAAAFVKRAAGPVDDFVKPYERSLADPFTGQIPGLTSLPHLKDVGVMGPFNPTGVSPTPSRARIFTCYPTSAAEEPSCATEIISTLARRAFRTPVPEPTLKNLLEAYKRGRRDGDFDAGIRLALQLILASPQFVFRFERTPAGTAPGTDFRVSDIELASRLSYFLWSSGPDDELIAVAARGGLRQAGEIERQVYRMLADPRAEALAQNFAGQWLYLRNLKSLHPDGLLYADSDENLFNSMRRETELFFQSIVGENRSVLELLTAEYTFVDERLAKHYRIPNIMGNRFRRVSLTDPNRFGLLGHGSILSVTSFSNRTSPVVRGKWVLEQLLGAEVPVPPPNVPLLPENTENVKLQSVRERLEEHRKMPQCASCHKVMDPIGFALENFDAVGAWRSHDSGYPVDATGALADGTAIDSPASLRQALLKRSDAFMASFTRKLLTYGLGRGLDATDMPTVRAINREAASASYRFGNVVVAMVKSPPFQMRRAEVEGTSNQVANAGWVANARIASIDWRSPLD
jgi:mono/diheme cytochrome c family protein